MKIVRQNPRDFGVKVTEKNVILLGHLECVKEDFLMQLLARPLIAASYASCLVSRPFAVIEHVKHVVEESLAHSPLAEAEQEVNARVFC